MKKVGNQNVSQIDTTQKLIMPADSEKWAEKKREKAYGG